MRIIKKTREVGKSVGVLLPKSWLNKNVSVQLISNDFQTITKDVLEFSKKYVHYNNRKV